jgi:N-6 DNA Methylase
MRAVRNRRPTHSVADMHRAWLALVDTDGPFLSVPVLRRVYSSGIPALDHEVAADVKAAKLVFEQEWDRQDKGERTLEDFGTARDEWVDLVLRRSFGWTDHYTTDPAVTVEIASPNQAVRVRSTGALVVEGTTAALVWVTEPTADLRDPVGDGWSTSAIDRMEQLLRDSQVRIGVVTDGRWWGLVHAEPSQLAASGVIDALTWVEETAARDAFFELLGLRRLAGGKLKERLPDLFTESLTDAAEITEALGSQVRRAIELLIAAFGESAAETMRRENVDPLPKVGGAIDGDAVYEAAVTVMMRVVFLLFAQQRDLLPESELFTNAYGLVGEREALRARAEAEGEEALDATYATWHRLLATSRALYNGASFEDARIPGYGGSIFDPTRFTFLSALSPSGRLAVPVSDRVMLHVLDSVQLADIPGEGKRPISFRDIDVEQIGYMYEGLLGFTCRPVTEMTVGLIGGNGAEPEISLERLNDLADEASDDTDLAVRIIAHVTADQPASKPPSKAALAKALAASDSVLDADVALRSVTRDQELADELATWLGAIRRDLRNRPTVFPEGSLLVVETPSRRNAGAHYTPRNLAEEVVSHALEPLVYDPGPLDIADSTMWRLRSPEDILELKVADIACGSGAFLVAAARYLAGKLVESWAESGRGYGTPHQQLVSATREVVAHCLYGADINPMAIEMCKLSLWLVSLDKTQPFSFVDDKVFVGNSLLGVTDKRQLEALHITPPSGDSQDALFHTTSAGVATSVDVEALLSLAARRRTQLASVIDERDRQRTLAAKRDQLRRVEESTAPLRHLADAVIAAGLKLGGKPGKALDTAYDALRTAATDAYPLDGIADPRALDTIIATGLTPKVATDYARWKPLHWAVELPEVMDRGGFDAIIGNPPFLSGKKITGAMGTNVRDWLVNALAGGTRGHADFVAYFFLRGFGLLNPHGMLGLIATSTVAQGDSREVSLDRMAASDFTICRAIQSARWPATSASVEYAAVWGTRRHVAEKVLRWANGKPVSQISTLLEEAGRVSGQPRRLKENRGIAYIGCYVLGMGFVITYQQAQEWIAADPGNAEVLFPYLNGEDINSRPDLVAQRWVVDFNDMSEDVAQHYEQPYRHIEAFVRPERQRLKPSGEFVLRRPLPEKWWQFGDKRPALRAAIGRLDEILAISRHSKVVMPLRVLPSQVISDACVVFATSSYATQGVLSSTVHQLWAITHGSTLGTEIRYTPSDVFETFPIPPESAAMEAIGRELDETRRGIMLRKDLGMTKLYNLINDLDVTNDPDVETMRDIHARLDQTVMDAYGWSDVPLNHGFHTYRQMQRWTVDPQAREELLDRLLEENHRRAVAEKGRTSDAHLLRHGD